jgi:hypothetical protein
VPPILIAILFVTVFTTDADTAVDANALPETVGKVIVGVPAIAGAAKVKVPLVSPEIVNCPMIYPIRTKC